MRVDAGGNSGGASGGQSMGMRFEQAMKAESDAGKNSVGPSIAAPTGIDGSTKNMTQAIEGIVGQIRELIQQLAQLIQSMSSDAGGRIGGASSIGSDGRTRSVESVSGPLGGAQGPSDLLPDPSSNVRQVQLGSKTMTIGSDGTASPAEVDAATTELQRMYDASPTFRQSIDGAGADTLTVTLGRRDDNTSWGGGGRVFLNLNDIRAGNNDRFQGIVGHEFAHAADGLGHGSALDAIESKVRSEA